MQDETTPQDAGAMPPASTGSVAFGVEGAMRRIEGGDIRDADARMVVRRLRECRSKTAQWCEQAAKARLTDAERDAIAYFAAFYRSPREGDAAAAELLRALLARLVH